MRRLSAYSIAWGSPTESATENHMPFKNNAEAKAARDAEWRQLKKEGRNVKRSVLKGQLRPYWGLGILCGVVCDVYEIYEF